MPALAYWLVIGGLVYEFIRHHDASAPANAEVALAPLTPPPPPAVREWWRTTPAKGTPPPSPPITEPSAPVPEAVEAPRAESAPAESAPAESAPAESGPENRFAAEAALGNRGGSTPTLRRFPRPAPGRPPSPASDPVSVNVPVVVPDPPPPLSPDTPRSVVTRTFPSCEAALASASQDVDFTGSNRAADLPTQAIAAVLENGAWLSSCAVPEHSSLDVCVAIKGGRVVGANVTSRPADSALEACVKRRASSLQFPYSPHLDLARTRF
ncbi:MAG: hypothetical protein WDO74_02390 [Pseudomonadota bacterium]